MTADRKQAAADAFDSAASDYLESAVHREGPGLDRLREVFDEASGPVVDVGSGAGHAAAAVVETGAEPVIALDPAPSMVRTAVTATPALEGVLGDGERLPIATDSVGGVTSRVAAHHLPNPRTFLEEVNRILRPGGTVVLIDNVVPSEPDLATFYNRLERTRDPTHVACYPLEQWRQWLETVGLVPDSVTTFRKTLAVEPWLERQSPSPERRQSVFRLLLEAEEDLIEAFEIEVSSEDGLPQSLTTTTAIITARNPD